MRVCLRLDAKIQFQEIIFLFSFPRIPYEVPGRPGTAPGWGRNQERDTRGYMFWFRAHPGTKETRNAEPDLIAVHPFRPRPGVSGIIAEHPPLMARCAFESRVYHVLGSVPIPEPTFSEDIAGIPRFLAVF